MLIKMLKNKIKKLIPDKIYIKHVFKKRMGYKLNFGNVNTYSEKLNWLKIYDRNPEYIKMVDKLTAGNYANSKIDYINPMPVLGVYDRYEDIVFDELPDEFVIKTNHSSGMFKIVRDKQELDHSILRKKFNKDLKKNYFYHMREWPYKNVESKIYIEELLKDESNTELKDYKFYCFNGKIEFFIVTHGKNNNDKYYVDFYNEDFEKINVTQKGWPSSNKKLSKPKNFDKMISAAKNLSKNIPHVRVDLYNINGEIFLGEFTFYESAGMGSFEPENIDSKLGDLIDLKLSFSNKKKMSKRIDDV